MMICRECSEDVKYGWRGGVPGWLHREEKDHPGFPVIKPEHEPPPEIPAPEVLAEPVEASSFPPRSGIRQVINLINKTQGWTLYRLTHSRGPRLGAKGDVLSISDTIVVGGREDPGLDGSVRFAIGLWVDGDFARGYTFTVRPPSRNIWPDMVNSTDLKAWIKGTPSDQAEPADAQLPDALQQREP